MDANVHHFLLDLKGILKNKITFSFLKRITIVLLFLLGHKPKKISRFLKCSEKTVYRSIKKFKNYSTLELKDKPRTGRKSLLSKTDKEKMIDSIKSKNNYISEEKVVHIDIIKDIINKNNINYSRSGLYKLCYKMGLRKVKPRPCHFKNNPEVMDNWKKELPLKLNEVQTIHQDKKCVIYYQDESRYGQKTISTGIWSPKPVRPEYKSQLGYLNSWIYGAINEETGKRFGLILPTLTGDNMQIFLNEFSKTIANNEHVLLILDGSGAHKNKKIIIPENITLHYLPAYSPQLNPIERVWLYLKKKYLSFKLYRVYDEIVEAGQMAWSKLTDKIIKFICKSQKPKIKNSKLDRI